MQTFWHIRGEAADRAMANARYGDRHAVVLAQSATHGISAQTLRREAAAARFLGSEIDGPDDLVTRLREAPMASIEHLARWWRIDRAGALAAARRVADGELSVRALEQAARAARSSTDETVADRRPPDQVFREAIAASLTAMGGKVEPYAVGGFTIPFDFRWWPSPHWPVIVIAVGPFADSDRYNGRRADLCLRADWHNRNSEALLVLPEPEALASYQAFRNENRLDFDIIASPTGRFGLTAGKEARSISRGMWSWAIVPFDR
ncbi:MAG TPA: hypothetical protein VGN91_16505 [Bosea sp. (in: a-proteobacteria)]|jgi:hypothetical protein|nr:hypothetical protein [Bosea sp. (in: a-proteobacteria)]